MLDYRRYIQEVKEVIVLIVKLKLREFRKANYSFRGNNKLMEISNLINSLISFPPRISAAKSFNIKFNKFFVEYRSGKEIKKIDLL